MSPEQTITLACDCGFLEIPLSDDYVVNVRHIEAFAARIAQQAIAEHLAKPQESAHVLPELPAEIQHAKENYFVFSPERAGELMREYALAAIAAGGAK